MKNSVPYMAVLLCAVVTLNACSTSKNSLFSEHRTESGSAKDENGTCFVQMKDGTIRNYANLKLVTGIMMTPHLIADNGTLIYPSEIIAYQNKDHYAVSQAGFASGRRSYLALETLPGFAVRIAKGKLNIYCKKYNSGARAADEYYLQLGNEGKIFAYTPELLNEMVKDNPEAADMFNNKKNKAALPVKLQATAAIVNNNVALVSKN